MGFRLFGVNVEVQIGFWIMAFLFGLRGTTPTPEVLIWMLVVFVSVLVHEYGHAIAIKRLVRTEPEITLHWMGGHTTWGAALPVSRRDHILVSLAGPFAGFALGGLVFAGAVIGGAHAGSLFWAVVLDEFLPMSLRPESWRVPISLPAPQPVVAAIRDLLFVNIWWGLINLAPVLPFDGGHVLEHTLGPKRARMAALVSCIAGAGLAVYFLARPDRSLWGTMLFGFAALQSFQLWRATAAPVTVVRPRPPPEPELSADAAEALQLARTALDEERFEQAISHAEHVLASDKSGPAARAALGVIAWAHLLSDRVEAASSALAKLSKMGQPDAALVGAVARAQGNDKEARRAFEAARAAGDDRKEIVGPLIQILIQQGEVARAAEVAHDIVESLSEEDARKMAAIAYEGRAFSGAARLFEAVFQRQGHAEDAYEAARSRAQAGEHEKALELLRRAVAAGFTDRARAWSDAALEALRADDHLGTVLPRP